MRSRSRKIVQILQFLDNEPVKILRSSGYKDRIKYFNKQGEIKEAQVKIVFATFRGGYSGAVLVAADRAVTYEEILDAYDRLIYGKDLKFIQLAHES